VTHPPRRWTSLPPPVEGVLWMAFACVCWVSNTLIIRPVTAEIEPIQMMFLRLAFSLVVMLPFVMHLGWSALRIRRKGIYAVRAALMFISMLAWIYSIKLLPIAEAVSLAFTAPLFATIMAAALLREKVGIRRWSAVVIGFLGALVILRPGIGVFDANAFIVLLNAATWAGAVIVIRVLTRTENPTVMVLYTFILLTPISIIPALLVWRDPSLLCWLLIATTADQRRMPTFSRRRAAAMMVANRGAVKASETASAMGSSLIE
jgi:drug/metabolite transporter (DMT)-like permease